MTSKEIAEEIWREDQRIARIASRYVKNDYTTVAFALQCFAGHLNGNYARQLRDPDWNVPDEMVAAYFRQYIERFPMAAKPS
jgi:hypothetical protein